MTRATNDSPELVYFDRALNLSAEIANLRDDLKVVYAEAKDDDIDVPVLRDAVKRSMETDRQAAKRRLKESAVEELLHRLGQLRGTPLGDAAEEGARSAVVARISDLADDPKMARIRAGDV